MYRTCSLLSIYNVIPESHRVQSKYFYFRYLAYDFFGKKRALFKTLEHFDNMLRLNLERQVLAGANSKLLFVQDFTWASFQNSTR